MTRPALNLALALALLFQALVGTSPAWAMADLTPAALCHASAEPGPVPNDHPTPHDCLACPACAAATAPLLPVPSPPELPRSSRVERVAPVLATSPTPTPARPAANPPTGPPRLS